MIVMAATMALIMIECSGSCLVRDVMRTKPSRVRDVTRIRMNMMMVMHAAAGYRVNGKRCDCQKIDDCGKHELIQK